MLKRLVGLFSSTAPTGFGTAGIRRQKISGAVLVVGDFTGQRGVETDEAGISISRLVVRYYLAVNDKMLSNVGEPRARAMSDKFSRDVTLEGEITAGDGVMAFTVATACALANDTDDFGGGEGDLLMDEATVTQARGEWRSLSMALSSDPGVTV